MPALTDAELADARAMQALAMQDECIIERYTGTSSWDPDSETTTRDKTTVYPVGDAPGICRAQAKSSTVVNQAGDTVTITTYPCAIPWDAPQIEPGDLLTVTTSADPLLTGPLTVTAVESSTFATARHFTATLNA